MTNQHYLRAVLLFSILLLTSHPPTRFSSALSPSFPGKPTQTASDGINSAPAVYRVVGIPGGVTQYLPVSYVKTFPRWQIDDRENRLVPLPALTVTSTDDNDATESCMAEHLTKHNSSVQPTLNFLIKGGVPAYVMAGLSLSKNSNNNNNNNNNNSNIDNKKGGNHNNRMIGKTDLLAQQWTTFAMTTEPNFRLEVFLGPRDGTDDRLGVVDAANVQHGMEQLGQALSNTHDDTFVNGFHIVTIPMKLIMDTTTSTESSTTTSTRRMTEENNQKNYNDALTLWLTCMATAEPDARELLTLEDTLIEMTATSKLDVEASKVFGSP